MINFSGLKIGFKCKGLLKKAFKKALIECNQDYHDFEVNLQIIQSEEMHELNKRTRDVDRTTDVLSFPNLDFPLIEKVDRKDLFMEINPETNKIMLGDISINIDKVKEQSQEYGHSENREFIYLFVHGMLHLSGYDHIEEEDKIKMRAKEEAVMTALHLTREK